MACAQQEQTRQTLADIDSGEELRQRNSNGQVSPRTNAEIKAAYYNYLDSAPSTDASRQRAITRLAQMELDLSKKIHSSSEDEQSIESAYNSALDKSIQLLETSLADYPDAPGNDKLLYQLAYAYEQQGDVASAALTLDKLVNQYNRSKFYAEAQFRLGEAEFAQRNYLAAEYAYSEVLMAPGAQRFYEKALFKRGWTRYKQELYVEAIDDLSEALVMHDFQYDQGLSADEQELNNEYFRAISLAFSYLEDELSPSQYFARNPNFKEVYRTHASLADLYRSQERYSDTARVLGDFVEHNPDDAMVPIAQVGAIEAWKQAGFSKRALDATETFYQGYNPESSYWQNYQDELVKAEALTKLRLYCAEQAKFFHGRYIAEHKTQDLKNAELWYQRHLRYFEDFARQDRIYRDYGHLLYGMKQNQQALAMLEKAAFDEQIVLDEEAAYLSIALSSTLLDQSGQLSYLEKLVDYSLWYLELYPNNSNSAEVAKLAAQQSYAQKQYQQTLRIAQSRSANVSAGNPEFELRYLEASSYIELKQFDEAKALLLDLQQDPILKGKQRQSIDDDLAYVYYQQAQTSLAAGNQAQGLTQLVAISQYASSTELAPKALYEALTLANDSQDWDQSIAIASRFDQLYPQHSLSNDVSKIVSIAYLKADRTDEAAKQFERISNFEQDAELKRIALWQAAELYEKKKDLASAIRTYRSYAHDYPLPAEQNLEAMQKLGELYQRSGEAQKRHFWQNKIVSRASSLAAASRTERSNYLGASNALELAQQSHKQFDKRRLVAPLQKNLKAKKAHMQEAIRLYGKASGFGLAETTTEATYSIAKIYENFASALLDSERPSGLSADELDQYEILLEDQAFPFEDKAIEFHEVNLARSQEGLYNQWLQASREQLAQLFPARYQRQTKIEAVALYD